MLESYIRCLFPALPVTIVSARRRLRRQLSALVPAPLPQIHNARQNSADDVQAGIVAEHAVLQIEDLAGSTGARAYPHSEESGIVPGNREEGRRADHAVADDPLHMRRPGVGAQGDVPTGSQDSGAAEKRVAADVITDCHSVV